MAKHVLIILREPIAVIFLALLIYFYVVYMQLELSRVIVISILFYRILTTLNQIQAEYLVVNVSQNYYWRRNFHKMSVCQRLARRSLGHLQVHLLARVRQGRLCFFHQRLLRCFRGPSPLGSMMMMTSSGLVCSPWYDF